LRYSKSGKERVETKLKKEYTLLISLTIRKSMKALQIAFQFIPPHIDVDIFRHPGNMRRYLQNPFVFHSFFA